MSFPQLQTITSYSLLSSTIRIQEYVKEAKKLGYQTLGLTDINVLHGAVEFYEACKQEGLQPIIGLTLEYTPEQSEETAELLLFAKDYQGYQHLIQLSSAKMTTTGNFYLTQYSQLLSHLFGVFPATKSEVALLFSQNEATAQKAFYQLKESFDENSLFVGRSFTEQSQEQAALLAFYNQLVIPPVSLQEVRYLHKEDDFALTVLTHLKENTQLNLTSQIPAIEGPFYLRAAEEAQQQLTELVGAEAIENSQKIAAQCQVEMRLHQKLLPHFPVPNGQSAGTYLQELCRQQLPQRIPNAAAIYQERLEMELEIIHKMGFDDYFLIVWDVMAFAHQQKIVTGAGRGSAAGSLVAYVLAITDVDPIKYDLLFERFLNPERYTMPDIDLDIPDNRREEVLAYVNQKYGHHHMAQIATFGTMAAKMVLRDVARVFGLSQSESNSWSKAVPNTLKITLSEALRESKKMQDLVNGSPNNQLLFETAVQLEGLPRHVSTHAAGVVISDENLLNLVPLQTGANDILLTQFTMNDVEKIGLLKMDFLGLRNLSIIDDTLRAIKRVYNQEISLSQIPLDDAKTLALFQKGATSGVFQFESAGIRNVLRKLSPSSIEDIAAVNALYRPGPMQNIDVFIRRKKGLEQLAYPDDSLEPILKNTYGIIVYQEQIMQVAAKMAGFSLGQADILRRAISKKKKAVLDEERNHFVNGALQQGYSAEKANLVYDYIERFANYGFNRSHAFAYSFIGFQMAYLKVYYPSAFYTALLHSVRHNPTKIKEYLGEARKNKQTILSPSINQSHFSFYLNKQQQILFGFSSLKGIRRDFIQNIIDERKQGKYQSFDDFLQRIDRKWLKAENILPLIAIGAFDEIAPNRRQLAVNLESTIQSIVLSGGSIDLLATLKPKEEEVADYTLEERLEQEEQYLGVYLSGHPTEEFKKTRLAKQVQYSHDLVENQGTSLLIYVKNVRVIRTKKGEQMAFVEGDDVTGEISLTLFPTVFRQLRQTIEKGQIYYVEGKVERSKYNQELQVLVSRIEKAATIENNISEKTCFLRIVPETDSKETLKKVQEVLQRHQGHIPVIIYFERTGKKIVLNEENWLDDSEASKSQLSYILGEKNIAFK
jgi:DNA polymerase-3 subunit alpha